MLNKPNRGPTILVHMVDLHSPVVAEFAATRLVERGTHPAALAI